MQTRDTYSHLLVNIGGDAVDGLDEAFGYAILVRPQPVSSEGAVC